MAFGFTSSFSRSFRAGERPVTITSASQLPNLEVWYNAANSASVGLTSGAVGSWDSTGTLSTHPLNSTGSNRPSYVTAAQNGLNVIRFNGSQYLTINPVAYLNTGTPTPTGFTMAMTFKSSSTATGARYVTATDQSNFTWGQNGTTSWIGAFGGATFTVNTIATDQLWHHVVITYNGLGATNADKVKVRYDATDNVLTFTGTVASTLTGNGYYYAGAKGTNATNATNGWIGDIGEILIWTRDLTTSEVLAVEGYLTNKWAI